MVGGLEDVSSECRDILLVMGKSVVRVGDAGSGNVTKLANQIMWPCTRCDVGGARAGGQGRRGSGFDLQRHFAGIGWQHALEAKARGVMDRT